MTFFAIHNLTILILTIVLARITTTSEAAATTAGLSFITLMGKKTKVAVYMSNMSRNSEEEILFQESMEPVKFNDDSEIKTQPSISATTTRKRGRPGIVVFSGGTAFNAAAAEMAARNVVASSSSSVAAKSTSSRTTTAQAATAAAVLDDGSVKSSENSVTDMMMSMMMMDTPSSSNTNNNNNNKMMMEGGGIKVWHVLPVTDDGGSTAEIVRILGGPAVGDIRSRLLRLAPGHTREGRAVRRLLGHRLVSLETLKEQRKRQFGKDGDYEEEEEEEITAEMVSRMAREEWLDIIDGGMESHRHIHGLHRHNGADGDEDNEEEESDGDDDDHEHPLWKGVSTPYRSIIRSFLVHFHSQVMQQHNGIRHSSRNPPFDFTGGSVGNFFFAGARTFFGSLPAAIFLFSKVAGIPSGSRVLPAVLSEERLVLGAELMDGTRLRGQFEISHPSQRQLVMKSTKSSEGKKEGQRDRSGSFKAVVKSFDTSSDSFNEGITSLHPSAMKRVCYLLHDPTWRRKDGGQHYSNNSSTASDPPSSLRSKSRVRTDWSDRHEVDPEPNPSVLEAISNANCVVYGCGSLFTSVLPSLVLRGVGESIVRKDVPRVLLLNGWHDHETTWLETSRDGSAVVKKMDATAIVQTIVNAFDRGIEQFRDEEDDNNDGCSVSPTPLITDYITHILYPIGSEIDINEQSLEELCASRRRSRSGSVSEEQNNMSSHQDRIELIGVPSIPADECVEGRRSGGASRHRIFDASSLVDTLLELANTNNV